MNELISANATYKISNCNLAYLGDEKKHPNAIRWWPDKHNAPTWNHNRIWAILKGNGFVSTVFGSTELKENCVYFFPGTAIISQSCPSYMEQFYVDFIPNFNSSLFDSYYMLSNISKEITVILELLRLIRDNYKKSDELSQFTCNSCINVILSRFIQDTPPKNNEENAFSSIINHINQHYCDIDTISIKKLADMAGYSQQHFQKVFKAYYRVSPKKYITNKKIIKAQYLLQDSSKSISEIAFACGFSDPLYFSRVFAEVLECSPSEYRAAYSQLGV